jgi:hypothetical protein
MVVASQRMRPHRPQVTLGATLERRMRANAAASSSSPLGAAAARGRSSTGAAVAWEGRPAAGHDAEGFLIAMVVESSGFLRPGASCQASIGIVSRKDKIRS